VKPKIYVKTRALSVSYLKGGGLFRERFQAVRRVSFDIPQMSCFALVGESGSGKSTVARALLGLADVESGTIRIGDFRLPELPRKQRKAFRREVQVVFQDPFLSLNPRLSVRTQIEEPLIIHRVPRRERAGRVDEVLRKVRLDPDLLKKRPRQLSGGERQRVCIARSLIVNPRFLIADEPVSSLDLSVQARIIDLLTELREEERLTMLFVSHDMELVRYVADHVGVMYGGCVVEEGAAPALFDDPVHPYTRLLLQAVPSRLGRQGFESLDLPVRREVAHQACVWQHNCAQVDMKCRFEVPPLVTVSSNHRVACHKALTLTSNQS